MTTYETIQAIIVIAGSYLLFNAFIKLITYLLLMMIFNKEYLFTIKLPIPKRFKTKIDPIYKYGYSEVNDWYVKGIYKYELKYKTISNILISNLILPIIPINIEKFGYVENEYSLKEHDEYGTLRNKHFNIEDSNFDIKSEYENAYSLYKQKQQLEMSKYNLEESNINKINKIFNENYES